MMTYPLEICAKRIDKIIPLVNGPYEEIQIKLECCDFDALYEQIFENALQQDVFEYMKENFDKDFLKEQLCI